VGLPLLRRDLHLVVVLVLLVFVASRTHPVR
jgi:hypothetical protein